MVFAFAAFGAVSLHVVFAYVLSPRGRRRRVSGLAAFSALGGFMSVRAVVFTASSFLEPFTTMS